MPKANFFLKSLKNFTIPCSLPFVIVLLQNKAKGETFDCQAHKNYGLGPKYSGYLRRLQLKD